MTTSCPTCTAPSESTVLRLAKLGARARVSIDPSRSPAITYILISGDDAATGYGDELDEALADAVRKLVVKQGKRCVEAWEAAEMREGGP